MTESGQLRLMLFAADRRTLKAGETLFTRGSLSTSGFVVQSGSIAMMPNHEFGEEQILGPGTLIGEMALIVPSERPCDAVAKETTSLSFSSSATFRTSQSLRMKRTNCDCGSQAEVAGTSQNTTLSNPSSLAWRNCRVRTRSRPLPKCSRVRHLGLKDRSRLCRCQDRAALRHALLRLGHAHDLPSQVSLVLYSPGLSRPSDSAG